MRAMFGWFSDASVLASRCEPGEPIGIVRERVGQDLDRDIAIELRVARAIHLAHAAFADRGGDLVGAEARAGGKGQSWCDYTGGAGRRAAGFLPFNAQG